MYILNETINEPQRTDERIEQDTSVRRERSILKTKAKKKKSENILINLSMQFLISEPQKGYHNQKMPVSIAETNRLRLNKFSIYIKYYAN